jgi:acetyl esterase
MAALEGTEDGKGAVAGAAEAALEPSSGAAVEDGAGGEAERDDRDRQQVAALLDALIEAGRPSSRTLPLPEGRRNFNEMVASLTSTGHVASVEDRTLEARHGRGSGESAEIPVRVYRPEGAAGNGPAALFVHGGGWVFGDLESHDGLCRALAEASGVVFVAVDYRRAPEVAFPGPLEDCLAAANWLAANGSELGIDGSRLAVVGDSSGANIAAAMAVLARDAGHPRIAIEVLAYPATDPSLSTPSYAKYADDPFLSRDEMAWYWDQYTAAAQRPDVRAAVARNGDHAGLPPTVVIIAGHDPLRDEGLSYAHSLAAAGVPVTVRQYPEMPHGFLLFGRYLDRAKEAIADAGADLAAGLGAR